MDYEVLSIPSVKVLLISLLMLIVHFLIIILDNMCVHC